MTSVSERKFLFSIFIADETHTLADTFASLATHFSDNARENAEFMFGPAEITPPEQIGLYHDPLNHRVIITGVASGPGLVEINETGQPQLVMVDPQPGMGYPTPKVLEFLIAVKDRLEIAGSMCTWIVVPLDELGGGFGTLHVRGMAGISGSS